ncbi:hypothetical protein [Leeia aquatica]|nr:hypothetical protein [Leeia aquatica]
MTTQDFADYSGPMEAELNQLEERIIALARLSQQLREENRQLRTELASVQQDNSQLLQKISTASQRLEQLIEQLPEDA